MTADTGLRLFEIVNRNFKNEEDARQFVAEIDKLISDRQSEPAKQLSTEKNFRITKSALKDDINASKLDLVKWMFGFWVTLVLLILANWFLKH